MQKTFVPLTVPNFEEIQSRLVPYMLETYPNRMTFWNKINKAALFEHVPELLAAVEELTGQQPFDAYLLAVPNAPEMMIATVLGANSIHADTSIESCRLNWPILNGSSVETRMFKTSAEPIKKILSTGETYLTYKESDCELIESFFLTQPVIMSVHTIHGLYRAQGPLPRYVLSFNFEPDIPHLLNP